jgi:hypothetical protein
MLYIFGYGFLPHQKNLYKAESQFKIRNIGTLPVKKCPGKTGAKVIDQFGVKSS